MPGKQRNVARRVGELDIGKEHLVKLLAGALYKQRAAIETDDRDADLCPVARRSFDDKIARRDWLVRGLRNVKLAAGRKYLEIAAAKYIDDSVQALGDNRRLDALIVQALAFVEIEKRIDD